jgi:hypothetical protein
MIYLNDKELFEFIGNTCMSLLFAIYLMQAGYRNQAMHQRLCPLLMDINNCGFGRRTFIG